VSLVAQLIAATAPSTKEVRVCECCGEPKSLKSFSKGTAKVCFTCYRKNRVKTRRAAPTITGPDQECDCCGEVKARHNFATGASGKPAKTCFQCYRTGPQLVQARADAKYKALLSGAEFSTSEIATKFGYSHCGALSSLLKLEKRLLIRRVGTRQRPAGETRGRGATVWTWVE